jgi:CBS domain-containing protein
VLLVSSYKNEIQLKTLEIVLDLAQKLHFQVIAKGIMNVDDLQILLRMGSQFGQGPLLEQPSPTMEGMLEGAHLIQEWLSQRGHGAPKRGRDLGSITRPVKTFDKQTPVAKVAQYFNEFEMETGVVVVEDEKPIGLVMRESLFRRLAFKYGYSLYWHREIANLMDEAPLILEPDTALETASRLSMERHRDQIYNLVIVARRGKLIGAVTIKDILNAITQEHMELARDANPLTGLPGNRRIEREIEQRIEADQPFAIIYVDLCSRHSSSTKGLKS